VAVSCALRGGTNRGSKYHLNRQRFVLKREAYRSDSSEDIYDRVDIFWETEEYSGNKKDDFAVCTHRT